MANPAWSADHCWYNFSKTSNLGTASISFHFCHNVLEWHSSFYLKRSELHNSRVGKLARASCVTSTAVAGIGRDRYVRYHSDGDGDGNVKFGNLASTRVASLQFHGYDSTGWNSLHPRCSAPYLDGFIGVVYFRGGSQVREGWTGDTISLLFSCSSYGETSEIP